MILLKALLAAAVLASPQSQPPLEATLDNGMHVVILANHLAPVVTTSLSYNVGSYDDTMPGIAHATEHMMFRGTDDLSSDQFAAIATRIGARYDAETATTLTRYYFTVPATYLDVVLRVEADRMQHASMREADWLNERGAIEQEVKAHLSSPILQAIQPVNHLFYGDSPWGKDGVGTIASFDAMKASDIAAFYRTWYHPDDATLVIAGDVDPVAALASVKSWFGAIPAVPVPAHPPLPHEPIAETTLDQKIDFPIPLAMLAQRLPGTDDPDWPALEVLFTALVNQRGALADLSLEGKVLYSGAFASGFPKGAVGTFVAVSLPGSDPKATVADLNGVIAGYAKSGVPDNLILAAKANLLSSAAYEGTSIPGQAREWTDAVAIVGRPPAQTYAALESVTPGDVNRVFQKYVVGGTRVDVAFEANPKAVVTPPSAAVAKENVQVTTDKAPELPAWTAQYFSAPLRAPRIDDRVVTLHLPNGMTIAVRHESASPTFYVVGRIRSNPDLYEPKGKEGVSAMTEALLQFGTQTMDYKSFLAALDTISASISPGTQLSAQARSEAFDRTIALLADAELHPAFPAERFAIVKNDSVKAQRATEDRPETKAAIAQLYAMYPAGDPHRRHPTAGSYASITLDDVKHWYHFAYRPDLATIVVVGDVSADDVKTAFEKYFGGWKAIGKAPVMDYPPVAFTRKVEKSVTIASTTAKQSDVTLTQPLRVRRGDRDAVALELANTMLSGEGTGSLLFRDVRVAHGYVYSIDSSVDVGDSSSTFSLTFASDPKNVERAAGTASATIERLRRTAPTLDELALAKAMLLSNYTVGLDSYSGVAHDLLVSTADGIDSNDRTRYYAQVIATTPQDIMRAMKRWIDPARFTRVIVAPAT
jgi:zinc protease